MFKNKFSKNSIFSALFTPKFSIRNVLLSLFVGILLGYLSLVIAYGTGDANKILKELFHADFHNNLNQGITYLVNKIVVIGLAGLAVAVALKANILNIGVSGQMTFGAIVGYLILNKFDSSDTSTFFIGLLVSIACGSALAMLIGVLKIFFKVNEVVTAIMLNWIVVFMSKYFETNLTTQKIDLNHPLYDVNSSHLIMYCIIGVIMFVSIALMAWFFFKKTAFGFKVIASGESNTVSQYSGYRTKRDFLTIFAISGAISGFAGFVLYYISSSGVSTQQVPTPYGFTGIAVALVGMNNPIGILGSATLFACIDGPFAGFSIIGYRAEVVMIFSSVITYFVAITSLWIYFRPIQIAEKYIHKYREKRKIVRKEVE